MHAAAERAQEITPTPNGWMANPEGVLSLAISHAITMNRNFINATDLLKKSFKVKRRDIKLMKVMCSPEQLLDFDSEAGRKGPWTEWWDETVEVCLASVVCACLCL